MNITVKREILRRYYRNITNYRKTSKVFTNALMLYKIEKTTLVQKDRINLIHIKMNKKHKKGKNTKEERKIRNEKEKEEK